MIPSPGEVRVGRRGRAAAFTLVELLVVVGILSVLVMIFVPSLGRIKALAYRADCASNLKAVGNSCGMYAADTKGALPTLFRTTTAFTTYWMREIGAGEVNLGILAEQDYAPVPKMFYCVSQEWYGNASLTYNGPDNAWDGEKVRSSYPARLIKVNGEPMPAGKKTNWNRILYGEDKVVYSDFIGVDGFQGGGIIEGTVRAPHRGDGYNRLFGEGSVRWCEPGELTSQIDEDAPEPEEQVAYYEELDELP